MPSIQVVHAALIQLKQALPFTAGFGICSKVKDFLPEEDKYAGPLIEDILADGFFSWEKFSGNEVYPIPDPENECPIQAFNITTREDMWNPEHPYGALRLELLDHLIQFYGVKVEELAQGIGTPAITL